MAPQQGVGRRKLFYSTVGNVLGWVGLGWPIWASTVEDDVTGTGRRKSGVIARPDDWVSRRSSDLARSCSCCCCCPRPDNAQRSASYDSSGLDLWLLQRQCLEDGCGGVGGGGDGNAPLSSMR